MKSLIVGPLSLPILTPTTRGCGPEAVGADRYVCGEKNSGRSTAVVDLKLYTLWEVERSLSARSVAGEARSRTIGSYTLDMSVDGQ